MGMDAISVPVAWSKTLEKHKRNTHNKLTEGCNNVCKNELHGNNNKQIQLHTEQQDDLQGTALKQNIFIFILLFEKRFSFHLLK